MAGTWRSATSGPAAPVGYQPEFYLVASPTESWTQGEGLWVSQGGRLLYYRGTESSTLPYGLKLQIPDDPLADGRVTAQTTKGSYLMDGAPGAIVERIFAPDEILLSIEAPARTIPNSTRMLNPQILFRDVDTYVEEGGMDCWTDITDPIYWQPFDGGMEWVGTGWTYNAGSPSIPHCLVTTQLGKNIIDSNPFPLIYLSLENNTEMFDGATRATGYDNNVEGVVEDSLYETDDGFYVACIVSPDGTSGGVYQIRTRNADAPPPIVHYWTQYRNTFEGET